MEIQDFEIDAGEQAFERKKANPPIDYGSRGVRLRLYMLFGGLMIVFFLMREAKKPESWRWMGFDAQGNLPEQESADPSSTAFALAEPKPSNLATGKQDAVSNVVATQEPARLPEVESSSETKPQDPSESRPRSTNSPQLTMRDTREYWKPIFEQLNGEEQKQIAVLLHDLDSGAAYSPEQVVKLKATLERLDQLAQAELLKRTEQLSHSSNSVEQTSVQTNKLLVIASEWNNKILPYLMGSVEKDLSSAFVDKSPLGVWQADFESVLLEKIQDNSGVQRTEDGPAWLAVWGRIQNDHNQTYQSVSRMEMMTQADALRGQPVRFSGTVVGIQPVERIKNSLGIEKYYILWIRENKVASPQVVCAFTLKLPRGIEIPEGLYVPADFDVTVQGRFFKIRNFITTEDELSTCPLILANQATIDFRPEEPANSAASPPKWFLLAMLGILIVSVFAALYGVYRGTRQRKYPVPEAQRLKISQNLRSLEQDSSLKTPREQIAELEREH